MDTPLEHGDCDQEIEDCEGEPTFHHEKRIDDATRRRIEAERERAQNDLEEALTSGDLAKLRAAITRGRRFRLAGLDEAAKALRKAEKKSSKQHKAEKRRGEAPSAPIPAAAAAAAADEGAKEKRLTKKDFYVEKQHKGMCRMHALNAFFQRAKLSEQSFMQLCRDFEQATGASRGSSEYFYVEEGGANILSFVVERDRRYRTVYYPPGMQAELDDLDEEHIVGYFEFDNGHVRCQ